MTRIEKHLEKKLKNKWKNVGKLPYTLVETWDHDGENEIDVCLKRQLNIGDRFTIENVTYQCEECDWFEKDGRGKAVVKMVRYRIPDTATTTVHKCHAKKEHFNSLSGDDIIRLEQEHGAKKVKAWRGKVKLKTYNKLESTCEFCKVVFWKKINAVPDTVEVELMMPEVLNTKAEGGLDKDDLDKQVKDGTWLQIGDEDGHDD